MTTGPRLPVLSRMRFGRIDEAYMNTLAASSNTFNDMQQSLSRVIAAQARPRPRPFLARLSSPTPIVTEDITRHDNSVTATDIVWRYDWAAVDIESFADDEFAIEISEMGFLSSSDVRNMTGDDDDGYALNVAELSNPDTQPVVFGVNMAGSSYPLGYAPLSIPDESIVWMHRYAANDARVIYLFDRLGVHDGPCA